MSRLEINRADRNTDLIQLNGEIDDQFNYKAPDDEQKEGFAAVCDVLKLATRVIVQNVPPCPDRTVALRKIREARMDANSAISHRGRY